MGMGIKRGALVVTGLNALTCVGFVSLLLAILYPLMPDELLRVGIGALFAVCLLAPMALVAVLAVMNRVLAENAEASRAYHAILRFPSRAFIASLAVWFLVAALGSAHLAFGIRAPASICLLVLAAGCCAGLIAGLFQYYVMVRLLRRKRGLLRRALPAGGREIAFRPVAMRTKLMLVNASLVAVLLSAFSLLAYRQASLGMVGAIDQIARPALRSAAYDLSLRLRSKPPDADPAGIFRAVNLPQGMNFILLDAEGRTRLGPDILSDREKKFALKMRLEGEESLSSRSNLLFFEPVPDSGYTLIAASPRKNFAAPLGRFRGAAVVVIAAAVFLAVGLGLLAGDEASRLVARSRAVLERSGILGRGVSAEAEEEIEVFTERLGRAEESVAALQGRVSEAARRVESAAEKISSWGGGLEKSMRAQGDEIRETAKFAEKIAESMQSITERSAVLSQAADESVGCVAELGATIAQMRGNISALGQSVEDSAALGGQIAESVSAGGEGVAGLAEVVEKTTSSMAEIAAVASEVERNSCDSIGLSREVIEDARKGRDAVRRANEGIKRIHGSARDTARVIGDLGRKTSAIDDILNVIDEVAEETNLLALNAAIIAAQAGEHGRGFGVVADEIKDLADRVGASTKEIAKLVHAFQGESRNAVRAVNLSIQNVEEGVTLSLEAEQALEKIMGSSQASADHIGEIANATREQGKETAQVVKETERLREMIEQIRSAMLQQGLSSERLTDASEAMRAASQQLEESVAEQSRSSEALTKNVEDVHTMAEQIDQAVGEQRGGAEQVREGLHGMARSSESNLSSLTELERVAASLILGTDALNEEVRRFEAEEREAKGKSRLEEDETERGRT